MNIFSECDEFHKFYKSKPKLYETASKITNSIVALVKIYQNEDIFNRINKYFDLKECEVFDNLMSAHGTIRNYDSSVILIQFIDVDLCGIFKDNQCYLNFIKNDINENKPFLNLQVISFYDNEQKIGLLSTKNITVEDINQFTNNFNKAKWAFRDNKPKTKEELEIKQLQNLLEYCKKPTIYFITEDPYQNRVKIGWTFDVKKRIKQLQTGSPNKLRIYEKLTSINCEKVEKILHKKLEDRKINGEWFRLTKKELNDFIEDNFDYILHRG